jgi:N-acyl-D-aspartate/D-glutamate deacylase
MILGESRSAGPVKPEAGDRQGMQGVRVDWATLGGYFARVERERVATNIASYVGEEQVWTYVKGYTQTPATRTELEAMKKLIAQAMEEGAMGLSTSLLMPPSSLATTHNLIDLARVSKQYGGSTRLTSVTKERVSSRRLLKRSRSAKGRRFPWTSST